MKIKVYSQGETTIDCDAEYQEPAIREAIEDGCNDVASTIIDYTDSERSDISHDHYAVVTEDDGRELWHGWLGGITDPPPVSRDVLEQLAAKWETEAVETSRQAAILRGHAAEERQLRAYEARQHARHLREAIGGAQ